MNAQFDYVTLVGEQFRWTPNTPTVKLTQRKRPRFTSARLQIRTKYWLPLRQKMLAHFQAKKGNAQAMAKYLGIAPSQLHRYTCPVCEHDQEPTFSIGLAIQSYLNQHQH